jgi:hypothetical protein
MVVFASFAFRAINHSLEISVFDPLRPFVARVTLF